MTQTVWRESASLILAAKISDRLKDGSHDYDLLMMKRSDRTAMVPNQAVFPGGLLESADESVEWLTYYDEFGVTQQALKHLVITSNEQRPSILGPQGNGCYDRFFKKSRIWAREISLRITAIRETFEEVGVLLCRNKMQLLDRGGCSYFKDDFDKKHWQRIVHNDAREFLRLCRELQVVPDVWGLYEWSAWASPAPIKKGFETVFFTAFLPEIPDLLTEETEVKECMWQSPVLLRHMYNDGELWLLPPQVYELSRFAGVKSFDVLLKFAQQRSSIGVTMYLPVGYICTDGMVSVLPGDDFYLEDSRSAQNFISIDSTMASFRAKSKFVHRCEGVGMSNIMVHLNFDTPDGHLSPMKPFDNRHKL